MDEAHAKIIEATVSELLNNYNKHFANSGDEFELCAVFTAALVFKNLVSDEFKKIVFRDSDDNPEDISNIIEKNARDIANRIKTKKENIN